MYCVWVLYALAIGETERKYSNENYTNAIKCDCESWRW